MKIKRVLTVLGIIALVSCDQRNSKSSSEHKPEDSSSTTSSEITSESSNVISSSSLESSSSAQSTSSQATSSSSSSSSSSSTSSSTTTSSTSAPVDDKELTFNFYNPSCGSFSTEVLNERLANYMNEVANTTFVESIKNTKCQIAANIPTKGNNVLVIGAASSTGSLEFTFSETIKAITITAQTYHKPYTDYQTGSEVPNVDSNSKLYIDIDTRIIDLTPVDGQPAEKEYTTALNSKSLKLYTSEEDKGRVFIKTISLIY